MTKHNSPQQGTPLIGREEELTYVAVRLNDPDCRLLTIAGPGGIGKTRLAIEAARQVIDDFANGAHFVDLQSVESSDFLSAIADVLPLSLSGREPPRAQLLNYLHDKELLLLLDNFEHLLEEATFLGELVSGAPAVKLLVTSREALNLQQEWLYPLRGLPVPPDLDGESTDISVGDYGAVQLFLERARRTRPDFSLEDERPGVIRICRLVEGNPLALKLAASWTKTLSCADIADEIVGNIDFLSTTLRDVPERHRSMEATFEQSWQLLADEERNTFKQLSLFKGSFDRAAARAVAGASLPILSALVDKSLVRREGESRYQIHELVRQYAAEKLQASPKEVRGARDRHGTYFLDFLAERAAAMSGGRQQAATAAIEAELANVRTAWEYAVEKGMVQENHSAFDTLYHFYQFQGRYREGANAFARAIRSLEAQPTTPEKEAVLADLLVCQAWLYIRLGRLELAKALLQKSRALYRRLDVTPPDGLGSREPRIPLGILAILDGATARAIELGEEALRLSERREDRGNVKYSCYLLANALRNQGDYEQALHYARRACTLAQQMQDRWGMAYFLNTLGTVAKARGEYAEARQHYQASYDLRKEFDDPEGMAVALKHLGNIALQQRAYGEARQLFGRSLNLYRELGDRGGLATSLNGWGRAAMALEKHQEAKQHFREALQIAAEIQFQPLALSILSEISELLIRTGQARKGIELLALAAHHEAGDREARERAKQRLQGHKDTLPQKQLARAVEAGETRDLETVIALLEKELTTMEKNGAAQPDEQPLAEPLTPRELEVLNLLAEGLSNREIAERLVIAVGTVKWYTHEIYGKLNVSNRMRAVARGQELGLLSPS